MAANSSKSTVKDSIGFIGIGNMGLPMAGRLIAAGYDVTAYDVSADALAKAVALGAKPATSPADVASKTEIVLISMPTPDIVRDVIFGERGIASGNRRKIVVDLSTTGPRASAAIALDLAKRDIIAIDAPVSGGVGGAQKGTLAVMVSGPKAECDKLEAVLGVFGRVFYIGDKPGQAQMMKLMNNLLSATAMAATSEAVVLGVKAGLDPAIMIEVINAGSGRNTASEDKFPKQILPRTFNQGFGMGLMTKDVLLALAEADALKTPMWIGNAVKQTWLQAIAREGADADFTEVIKHLEAAAGVIVGKARSTAAKG